MESPGTKKERKPKRLLIILITTVVSIGVTIIAASITIKRSEKQAILAEAERVRSVKNNLVSIIEEHIINKKPIDNARLIRMIKLKSREERLITRITSRDLIEQAEYNILNSRYLDFNKKEEHKKIFEQLYKEAVSIDYAPFKDIQQAELLNKLAKNIREGNKEESLNLLGQYVENVRTELVSLEKKARPENSLTESLLQKPSFYIFMIVYFIFIIFFIPWILRLKHRMRLKRFQIKP